MKNRSRFSFKYILLFFLSFLVASCGKPIKYFAFFRVVPYEFFVKQKIDPSQIELVARYEFSNEKELGNISEPSMPEKDYYKFFWQTWEKPNPIGSFVVTGAYIPIPYVVSFVTVLEGETTEEIQDKYTYDILSDPNDFYDFVNDFVPDEIEGYVFTDLRGLEQFDPEHPHHFIVYVNYELEVHNIPVYYSYNRDPSIPVVIGEISEDSSDEEVIDYTKEEIGYVKPENGYVDEFEVVKSEDAFYVERTATAEQHSIHYVQFDDTDFYNVPFTIETEGIVDLNSLKEFANNHKPASTEGIRCPVGYEFDEWENDFDASYDPLEDVVVKAKYKPIEYAATFYDIDRTTSLGSVNFTIENNIDYVLQEGKQYFPRSAADKEAGIAEGIHYDYHWDTSEAPQPPAPFIENFNLYLVRDAAKTYTINFSNRDGTSTHTETFTIDDFWDNQSQTFNNEQFKKVVGNRAFESGDIKNSRGRMIDTSNPWDWSTFSYDYKEMGNVEPTIYTNETAITYNVEYKSPNGTSLGTGTYTIDDIPNDNPQYILDQAPALTEQLFTEKSDLEEWQWYEMKWPTTIDIPQELGDLTVTCEITKKKEYNYKFVDENGVDVPGYSGTYNIDTRGNLFNVNKPNFAIDKVPGKKFMSQWVDDNGILLDANYVGKPDSNGTVFHPVFDGNDDYFWINLEYATSQTTENIRNHYVYIKKGDNFEMPSDVYYGPIIWYHQTYTPTGWNINFENGTSIAYVPYQSNITIPGSISGTQDGYSIIITPRF